MCDLVYDDAATVYRETVRTARKTRTCAECGMPILVGVRYVERAGLQDGSWWRYPAHVECHALLEHLALTVCGGSGYLVGSGSLRKEVRDHQHDPEHGRDVLRRWRGVLRARVREGVWAGRRAA